MGIHFDMPPSWWYERKDCGERDEWRPDERADEQSRRYEEQHGAFDPEERAA